MRSCSKKTNYSVHILVLFLDKGKVREKNGNRGFDTGETSLLAGGSLIFMRMDFGDVIRGSRDS